MPTEPIATEFESAEESPGFLLWQVANVWQRRQRAAQARCAWGAGCSSTGDVTRHRPGGTLPKHAPSLPPHPDQILAIGCLARATPAINPCSRD